MLVVVDEIEDCGDFVGENIVIGLNWLWYIIVEEGWMNGFVEMMVLWVWEGW